MSDQKKPQILKQLYEYFPTAVDTGRALVFISDEWRVELTSHKTENFSQLKNKLPTIRVKIFKKALNGEFVPGHYEDFKLDSLSDLASQIERYVQFAVGTNLKENA